VELTKPKDVISLYGLERIGGVILSGYPLGGNLSTLPRFHRNTGHVPLFHVRGDSRAEINLAFL
jgi:hypothetical protein